MSDSGGTDPEVEPEAGEPKSGFAAVEEGVGHLFAAMEAGVLNIVGAEAEKRRRRAATEDGTATAEEGGAAVEAGAVAAEDGTAAVEGDGAAVDGGAIAAEASTATGGADHGRAAGGSADLDLAGREGTESPTPVRESMTYEHALAPIRWRTLAWGALGLVAMAALYFALTLAQVWAGADDEPGRASGADAIVVLGAAQFDGKPSPVLAARLDQAFSVWTGDPTTLLVTTGSNQEGDRFTEGFSGFVYLRDQGVPEDRIINIVDGVDTYQQLSATLNQLEERNLDRVLLVSDPYHNVRLLAIADELGMDAKVAPTDIDPEFSDYVREATAVSIGRLASYRRLSAWTSPAD